MFFYWDYSLEYDWDSVPNPPSFFEKKLGKKLSNATQSVAIMGFQRELIPFGGF